VFALAVDLIFVDGVINVHEKEFIEELAIALAIDANRAIEIASVIEIKNSFSAPPAVIPVQAGMLTLLENWIAEYGDRADPDLDEQQDSLERSQLQFEQR